MVRKPSRVDAGTGENKERKGLWSPDEDERLFTQITLHGVSTWSSVAQLAGLRRSGKSCRLRWMNYLRPDLKKEPISKREEEIIVSLQQSLGNRWSTIAARMPGRTDNEIKNYWNSRIRKQLNAAAKAGRATSDSAEEPSAIAAGEKEESMDNADAAAAPPLPIPARFPVFACQLLVNGGGGDQSTTTTTEQQNSWSEDSEASVGDGNMIHDFLAFDELDYLAELLMDMPGVMDAWESELYSSNSMGSLN
ncbi:hypothetical protein PR202_gb26309 [Eleusine coracana subsp. coracana]|uniref:Uncharacterized protein n=1 Tax=Eleusine coracana subsp. coracana TaxID=191504 RepID=A0AAV5FQW1_ELECO|nr:hypothetical protein QOZ80_1BG0059740 [Eleusine coracana subsp. coracana]KAK3160462.1 hypothetical protein QOZ80_1BG0059770 [Eleusine coracana subsp. coracana]GJN37367.1 hypothetical protein PR202_gb26309 [Eleusine coracana subsp. coracana]